MNKIAHISQFAIFAKLISLKTIELNRVSIFFHEIFRINVESHFDLTFWIGILNLIRPLKKFGGQILKFDFIKIG